METEAAAHRYASREQERIRNLIDLIPKGDASLLDAGARDGRLSVLLADHFESVTALDQKNPAVCHRKVISVQGDITSLKFPDNSFDSVMCTEVLEHIPERSLERACSELRRVAKKHLLIGVPYRQDLRVARTTCYLCGKKNPPWGHVNAHLGKNGQQGVDAKSRDVEEVNPSELEESGAQVNACSHPLPRRYVLWRRWWFIFGLPRLGGEESGDRQFAVVDF